MQLPKTHGITGLLDREQINVFKRIYTNEHVYKRVGIVLQLAIDYHMLKLSPTPHPSPTHMQEIVCDIETCASADIC